MVVNFNLGHANFTNLLSICEDYNISGFKFANIAVVTDLFLKNHVVRVSDAR